MKILIVILNILFITNHTYCQVDLDVQYREYLGIQSSVHSYESGVPVHIPICMDG